MKGKANDLVRSKFGMLEMELAAARYLECCYIDGKPYMCNPTQFADDAQVLVGFCKLIEGGWFIGGTYNSEFKPTQEFLLRLGL